MKNFHYFFLFVIIFTLACEKNLVIQESENVNDSFNLQALNQDSIETKTYSITGVSNKAQAHEVFAYALSKAVFENQEFRNFLGNHINSQGKSYNEVIICDVKDQSLGDGNTIGDVLNSYLRQQPVFDGNTNPLQIILNLDPLIMTKISDVHHGVSWDPVNEILPVVSNEAMGSGYSAFVNGMQFIPTNYDGKNIYSLIVYTSFNNLLVNKTNGNISTGLTFKQYFGFGLQDCQSVNNYIQSQSLACGSSIYVSANIFEIRKLYDDNCVAPVPNGPPGPPPPPDPEFPDCPRANWEKNYNSFEGFWLGNIAAFNLIDNSPCPGGEQNFAFQFNWIHGIGGNAPEMKDKQFPFTRNQVLNPGVIKYKTVAVGVECLLFCGFYCCYWRTINIKVKDGYLIDPYPEYMDIHAPIFAKNSPSANDWQPDLQGRFITVKVVEFDSQLCNATQSSAQTHSISGQIQFGKKNKPTGSINWSSSFQYMESYQISS